MEIENDPNVLYGGDPEEYGPLIGDCASFGDLILKDLKTGGDRASFVSKIKLLKESLIIVYTVIFFYGNKINGMTHKTGTYNDLLRQSIGMANALHAIGVRQNDVIAIVSENRHEYPAIAFGAFYLNAIVAPINITYTERKIISLSMPYKCYNLLKYLLEIYFISVYFTLF